MGASSVREQGLLVGESAEIAKRTSAASRCSGAGLCPRIKGIQRQRIYKIEPERVPGMW